MILFLFIPISAVSPSTTQSSMECDARSRGRSSSSQPYPAPQRPSWIVETFIDGDQAESSLSADRAGFVQRNDIMNHIPGHIKKRITHPNPESQISGFEQLFVHLNSHPGPRNLRRLVVAYFNENLPLRPHLSQSLFNYHTIWRST